METIHSGANMQSFFVGLLVLILFGAFSIAGLLLFPLILVLGFFLRIFISVAFVLFAIWLIGKLTVLALSCIHKKSNNALSPP